MLVLVRKQGEYCVITLPDGREIRVAVAGIDRGKVRLAFTADADIIIHRSEVHDKWHNAHITTTEPTA